MTKRRLYALGGEFEMTGDPNDPNNPPRLTPAEIKKKYAKNQYVTNGRETWGQSLDATLPMSGNKVKVRDAITNAVKQTGLSPSLLYTSAMEEGLGFALSKPNDASEAYVNWEAKNAKLASQYRIDGFYNYGLDRFGETGVADNLIKKGYLPADFKTKFTPYDAVNEKKEKIKTAAFLSDQDALTAKAAMIKDTQDQLAAYSKKKGYNLTPEQNDFFTLAGYNGGLGNMQKMIDSYNQKGYLKDNKFLDPSFKPASYGDIYTNVQRRLQNRQILESEGFFKYGGKMPKKPKGMKYENGTEDPILGNTGPQLNPNAKNVGVDVFKNAITSPVPINPNAPANEQIFAINEQKGTPNEQGSIVPLSQFYDTYTDQFGNKQLRNTGQYVNNQGQVNTLGEQQTANNQISADNLAEANRRESNMDDAELYASAGITAINAFFNKKEQGQQSRKNRRTAIMQEFFAPVVNPYAEGTGSQAIFKKGGEIDGANEGVFVTDGGKAKLISSNNHSNPMMKFSGKEHTEGGIGIQYGDQVAEVENNEIGWVDQEGGLNIFGKLKMPGTNQTFKTVAKNIAEQEKKVDGLMSKYTNILNNGDPTDPYQETAHSTAKVMFKSLDKQSKQIAEKKEALASYQNLILSMVDAGNGEMKYGGKMPRKIYENGGKLDPNDPKSVQAIIDKYSGGKAPLKAEDFIEVSQKYGVPLDLMLAQAIQESAIGTKGMATRSHNIFNVRNNGNTGRLTDQGSWKQGLENYAKLIRDEYTSDGRTVDVNTLLSTDFKRPKRGGYYAEEKGEYTGALKRIISEINPDNAYTFSGKDEGFKYKTTVFSRNDAKQLYDMARLDEEHPLNSTDNADFRRLEQYLGIGGDPYPKTFGQFKGKDGKQYASPNGLAPSAFYKDPSVIAALKADQTFPKAADDANWGPEHQKVWDNLPQAKKDELLQKSVATPTQTGNGLVGGTTGGNSLDYVPKYEPIDKTGNTAGMVDTPYGPAKRDATPFSDKVNIGNGGRTRDYISPLALEQIAPELLTIATNKRQAVEQLTYQPDLMQTFDISYQLGRNENQSTFNQVAKIAEQTGNVDALSQMAAQKYKADEQYNMQEIQGNATQKLGVYNQNINTLNDAKVKNLALIADQQNKQAAAEFNTRKEDIGAFTSIAGKVLQNNLENKTYNAYANLFQHYGFDKKGNVTFNPDEVAQKFTAGEALQFGMLSAQQGASAIMNGDFSRQFKKVKNADGSTTTTETLGTNKKIQEEYKALKSQGFDDNIIGNMLRAKYPETISQD